MTEKKFKDCKIFTIYEDPNEIDEEHGDEEDTNGNEYVFT